MPLCFLMLQFKFEIISTRISIRCASKFLKKNLRKAEAAQKVLRKRGKVLASQKLSGTAAQCAVRKIDRSVHFFFKCLYFHVLSFGYYSLHHALLAPPAASSRFRSQSRCRDCEYEA